MFYLHGALHFYVGESQTRKITFEKNSRYQPFINHLIDITKPPLCIFQPTTEEKLDKIRANPYLSHCFEKLQTGEGILFIIGWSCSENDSHIIEAINHSNFSMVIISYYDESEKEEIQG